jgi:hypothetical protein
MLREDVPGRPMLVAYVTSHDAPATDQELRRHVRQNLPDYMVPSVVVFLKELPLTSQGKLHRAMLPRPGGAVESDRSFTAPRSRVESVIAGIWRMALGVDKVGVHDNFFDLGGHSLLLMPVIYELDKQLDVKVRPGELVLPTLGQLASLCEERMQKTLLPEPGGRGFVARLVSSIRGGSGEREGN